MGLLQEELCIARALREELCGTLLTAGCLSYVFMKKQGCVFARVRRTAEFIASVCRKKQDFELKVSN